MHIWNGPGDGENPYQGYLAAADRIVVTPDSVNMLSEACAAGKPVFTLLPAFRARQIDRSARRTAQTGLVASARWQCGFFHIAATPPLRELAAVAGKVWHVLESTRPDRRCGIDQRLNQANRNPSFRGDPQHRMRASLQFRVARHQPRARVQGAIQRSLE